MYQISFTMFDLCPDTCREKAVTQTITTPTSEALQQTTGNGSVVHLDQSLFSKGFLVITSSLKRIEVFVSTKVCLKPVGIEFGCLECHFSCLVKWIVMDAMNLKNQNRVCCTSDRNPSCVHLAGRKLTSD